MIVVIGFGSLAKSLLTFVKPNENILVFSRDQAKVEEGQKDFPFIQYANMSALAKAKHVFICLPASSYQLFFDHYGNLFSKEVIFYSFATALMKDDVEKITGKERIVPCKCIGQAEQMKRDHKGMLVIPRGFEKERNWLQKIFDKDMLIIEGDEKEVLLVNQEATKAALEMAINLKKNLEAKKINKHIIDHTLEITTRGVILSYMKSELGGFGKQLLKEIENNRGV